MGTYLYTTSTLFRNQVNGFCFCCLSKWSLQELFIHSIIRINLKGSYWQKCYLAYTAISIYVVGSKLQAYATRPKGGMGRLELILGFRGCRREMDMKAEIIISMALRVLTKSNKNRYDSYCLKAVPLFETVKGLKGDTLFREAERNLNQPRLAKILHLSTSVKETRNLRSSQNFNWPRLYHW